MPLSCKFLTIPIILSCMATSAAAQEQGPQHNKKFTIPSSVYLGPGVGLDYGGLGIKWEIKPVNLLGFFAGVGYNLAKLGYNAGIKLTVLPHQRYVQPFLTGMYGYHTVVREGNMGYKEVYYGCTAGAGLDIILGKNLNHLSLSLLCPIRDKDLAEKASTPVLFSAGIGFRF